MKFRIRFLSVLLPLLLLLSMAACGTDVPAASSAPTASISSGSTSSGTASGSAAADPEPAPPSVDLSSNTTHELLTDDPVLIARRNAAEAYMRRMATVLWRTDEDLLYTVTSNITPEESTGSARLELKAGRLYRGVPYSYAGCTGAAFLDYAGQQNADGTYPVSGMTWQALSGSGTKTARLGNDCSGALAQAWAQIGASIRMTSTQYMVPERGYLRVGEYTSSDTDNTNSSQYCTSNGSAKMFAAYAQLQKADAVVRRSSSSGHTMMVVKVTVVTQADGSIDGVRSKVTVLEQSRSFFRAEKSYFDQTLNEQVYEIFGVDKVYTFYDLFNNGYLPITCREFIDPAPVAAPQITDTQTAFIRDTLCEGTLSCNWFMDALTMTITDEAGSTVQQATINAIRGSNKSVDLQRFLTDEPERMHGDLDPGALQSGRYHCTLVVRLSTEEEITVRDFDFTV